MLTCELQRNRWHRPYLHLFESVLVNTAADVARSTYGGASAYVTAAKTLRLPFLDWARPYNVIKPAVDALCSPTITVTRAVVSAHGVTGPSPGSTASGVTTIENPLFGYRFQRDAVQRGAKGQLTLRYPTADGVTDVDAFRAALRDESTLLLNLRLQVRVHLVVKVG